jgi:hypothetical protein
MRFYGGWEKDGIKLRGVASDVEKAHTSEEYSAVVLVLSDLQIQDLWWSTTEPKILSKKDLI